MREGDISFEWFHGRGWRRRRQWFSGLGGREKGRAARGTGDARGRRYAACSIPH